MFSSTTLWSWYYEQHDDTRRFPNSRMVEGFILGFQCRGGLHSLYRVDNGRDVVQEDSFLLFSMYGFNALSFVFAWDHRPGRYWVEMK